MIQNMETMIQNYLKTAFRHLSREKLYAGINIAGLSLGAAVVILIFLYVRNEWTFDTFHEDNDRIYRAWVKEQYGGDELFYTTTSFVLGRELEDNFPEVEQVVQYFTINGLVRKGTFIEQEQGHVATPSFLKMFSFPLKAGDPESALSQPNGVILTEELAVKYFGEPAPMGKTLDIQIAGSWQQFQVTGIAERPPRNSSIQFQMILPFELSEQLVSEQGRSGWPMSYLENYIKLSENTDITRFEAKLAPFIDSRVPDDYGPGDYQVGFQALTDIHLNNDIPAGIAQVSDWRYPYILSAIALLILLLAAINYVTLAVGRSVTRAKEVGVRKVTGATRRQLMLQFLSESVFYSLLAVATGWLIAGLFLKPFNRLLEKSLVMEYSLPLIGVLAALGLLLGLLAGIYPAFLLSRLSPIRSLRGAVSGEDQDKHLVLRSLVGAQFVLSVGLIICTSIMHQQMRYLQHKNLGFDQEQLLSVPFTEQTSNDRGFAEVYQSCLQKAELLRNELAGEQGVLDLTTSSHTLGVPGWTRVGFTDPASNKFRQFYLLAADYDFFPAMDIELAAGRNFSRNISADAGNALIINQAMAREYGWAAYLGQPLPAPFEAFRLIGIVQDFHFASLHTKVEPLAVAMDPIPMLRTVSDVNFGDNPTPKVTLRLAGGDIPATIKAVETAWRKIAPDQPFNYAFVDDSLNAQYRSEQYLSKGLTVATLLAIFIAALGLFGIATLTSARRTKEIGVRKVMGASTWDILLLLNRGITWLVLGAALLATPLAWYLMQQWLSDFAYQVAIRPQVVAGAAAAALAVAWLAVSYQSLKAATRNPVESLRHD